MENNFQEISLYKGEVKLKFFPATHIYMMNGKRCKSPTGAIGIIDKSKALMSWQADTIGEFFEGRLGQAITEDMIAEALIQTDVIKKGAANIGTEAHEWIEQYVKGNKPAMPQSEGAAKAVAGFLDWVKQHKVKFIASEKLVYSKKHNFAGTLDGIAKVGSEKKPFLIDYKVSNGLYPGVALQTAAYQLAESEESGLKFAGRWAIRLSKETEEEYNIRQEKKLKRYMKKTDGKSYEISPWKPFEARLMGNYERDAELFITALKLAGPYQELDREFFNAR